MATSKKPRVKKSSAKKKHFQVPKGTYDILPEDQAWWEKIRKVIKEIADFYGFGRIDTPILEDAELFVKATGEVTDIVEKQMYEFKSKGGDLLALRPEFTPGVIRAYLENGLSSLPQPIKLYSYGPLFRYEKPQAGRYRQFQQLNFEIVGKQTAVNDVQIIHMFFVFFKELGLNNINLQINSIGCPVCRPNYKKTLVNYYRSRLDRLCGNCKKRFKSNPLRLLDCKEEKCLLLIGGAPHIIDHLCEECNNHFKSVLEFLDELEIPYILNPHLVRGLDYYTKTVFEFWPEGEESRQGALGGGGRYDLLVKLLGGKDTPAVGGGIGLERVIAQLQVQEVKAPLNPPAKVFLIQLGELAKRKSFKIFEELRKANISVTGSFSRDSIKSQLRLASNAGAKVVLILGQQEVLDSMIIMRDMRTGAQEVIRQDKLIKELRKRLTKKTKKS